MPWADFKGFNLLGIELVSLAGYLSKDMYSKFVLVYISFLKVDSC